MQYRKFGNTDLLVSEIGFGAWAIGGGAMIGNTSIGWGDSDDTISKEAITACICADGTARIYLDLSKINGSLGVAINSVSVNLNDGGVNTGYAKLGKVKVATNTSSYSSEANTVYRPTYLRITIIPL